MSFLNVVHFVFTLLQLATSALKTSIDSPRHPPCLAIAFACVTANSDDDMSHLVVALAPERWKVFQVGGLISYQLPRSRPCMPHDALIAWMMRLIQPGITPSVATAWQPSHWQ